MAGDGLHIVDAAGSIVFANKAMCDMLGYLASELMGRRAIDLMPQAALEGSEQALLRDIYARDFADYFEVIYQ